MNAIRFLIPLLIYFIAGAVSTWSQDLSCSATVEKAFAALGENCADLQRNSLCYGNPQVHATFAAEDYAADFATPAARASIVGLSSLTTGALDTEQSHWGVSVMNLGANLPQTYDGPGIIVMLAGAAEAVNEVEPARVMEIQTPLSTAALEETTRFKNPGVIPAALGSVAEDEVLLVDAYDKTGQWLRVVTDGTISWIESDKVARLQTMDSLPRLALGETFAMRAFSLTTGTDYPDCDKAEPMVAIQTPEDLEFSLTVNGVDIHIGSMVTFQQVHRNALSMTVHRGEVTTIFGQRVRQSESILGIVVATAERDAEVVEWSGALPASDAELARGHRAQDAINRLARANGWAEYEAFDNPADIVHVVKPGETLYGLTALYDTSVEGIIAANGGGDDLRLLIGMEVVVPKPGSGFAWRGAAPSS